MPTGAKVRLWLSGDHHHYGRYEQVAPGEASGASDTGAARLSLAEYLDEAVFADAAVHVADPDSVDVAGFAAYLDRYSAGLAVERSAITAL